MTEEKIISKEEIKKVAELSRIELSDSELEKVAGQLESVLGSVKVLEEIETGNPDGQKSSEVVKFNDLRADEVKESEKEEKEAIRKNFSSRKENYLSVKAIF